MTPVVVNWHDAHSDRSGGWTHREEIDTDPYVVRSIGWRIEPAPKPGHVTIAQSLGEEGVFDSVLHIPTGWVLSICEITI